MLYVAKYGCNKILHCYIKIGQAIVSHPNVHTKFQSFLSNRLSEEVTQHLFKSKSLRNHTFEMFHKKLIFRHYAFLSTLLPLEGEVQ